MSHPSRVRGLKCILVLLVVVNPCMSHPSRVRGLKCYVAHDILTC